MSYANQGGHGINPAPTTSRPDFQPQGQNQQEYYQPPAQAAPYEAPIQPTQPIMNPTVVNNGANFVADADVLNLMQMVHPELKSAMINLAIKKFSEDPDFNKYFIQEQFKIQLSQNNAVAQTEQLLKESKSTVDNTPSQSGMDFSAW